MTCSRSTRTRYASAAAELPSGRARRAVPSPCSSTPLERGGALREPGVGRRTSRPPVSLQEDNMNIGIIGSGIVAQTLAGKLLELGHSVMISSRDTTRGKEPAPAARALGGRLRGGAARARAGGGGGRLRRRRRPRRDRDQRHGRGRLGGGPRGRRRRHLTGKILIDVGNPLDYSRGMPPTLYFCNTDSLAERIQAAFPDARVVKTLNTVTAQVMGPASCPRADGDLRRRQRPGGQGLGPQGTARALVRLGAGARPR